MKAGHFKISKKLETKYNAASLIRKHNDVYKYTHCQVIESSKIKYVVDA